MDINKAQWSASGDTLNLRMPIAKVDKENRLVSGFASLDNVDRQGDQISASANEKAFNGFRKNIREMHGPVAVGTMIDFNQKEYFDPQTNKTYQGIFVTAYISKGAPNTWEKVLDGTLSGFSIGGNIMKAESVFNKEHNGPVRVVEEYELVELSLVDSPANQLANIMSIQKLDNGNTSVKGIVSKADVSNVFWCPADEIAQPAKSENLECIKCAGPMENIGWYESDSSSIVEVQNIVKKHIGEGGAKMTVENDEVTPVVEVTQPEVTNDFETILAEVRKTVSESSEASQAGITALEAKLAEMNDVFEKRSEALNTQHAELVEKFTGISENLGSVEKRLDSVETSTAIKKSDVLEPAKPEKIEKSFWGGKFMGVSDLNN